MESHVRLQSGWRQADRHRGEPYGRGPISDGKVDGDDVSFHVVRNRDGQEFKLAYKGKVKGNEIMLTLTVPGMDQAFAMTAKKAS